MRFDASIRKPARNALAAVAAAAVVAALALVPAAAANAAPVLVSDPASYVNPIIGSANAGNTFPGAVAPFGMLSWSPEESRYVGPTSGANAGKGTLRTPSPSGYEYSANSIRGFSLTHVSGAGCTGLSGDIPFFPLSGALTQSPSLADSAGTPYASTFSHANETATAGSYSVGLDSGVDVDLAATTRTGSGSFDYPTGKPATMLIRSSDSQVGSSDATVSVDAATRTVSARSRAATSAGPSPVTASCSAATTRCTSPRRSTPPSRPSAPGRTPNCARHDERNGRHRLHGRPQHRRQRRERIPRRRQGLRRIRDLDTTASQQVNVRVGISYVSLDNAAENLETENPAGTTIDDVRDATTAAWNDQLGSIQIGGGTDDERTTFYKRPLPFAAAPQHHERRERRLHRLRPQDAQGGEPAEGAVRQLLGLGRVPLAAAAGDPAGCRPCSDIAASLLNQANQNDGVWDRWTHNSGGVHVMVGDPSAAALAGILAFGGKDFPVEEAYDSLATAARVPTDLDSSRAAGMSPSRASDRRWISS